MLRATTAGATSRWNPWRRTPRVAGRPRHLPGPRRAPDRPDPPPRLVGLDDSPRGESLLDLRDPHRVDQQGQGRRGRGAWVARVRARKTNTAILHHQVMEKLTDDRVAVDMGCRGHGRRDSQALEEPRKARERKRRAESDDPRVDVGSCVSSSAARERRRRRKARPCDTASSHCGSLGVARSARRDGHRTNVGRRGPWPSPNFFAPEIGRTPFRVSRTMAMLRKWSSGDPA